MTSAQERVNGLLEASRSIISERSLATVLQQIVEVAKRLGAADYAALGVVSPAEGALEEFVHSGLTEAQVADIGGLPQGRGLLGALIADPRPLRLRDLMKDARAVGMPPGHPTMRAFLGVPIRVQGRIFGNLYLTRRSPDEFSSAVEELIVGLAATAGVAIENARLFEQARQRSSWLEAGVSATREILSTPSALGINIVVDTIWQLTSAEQVCVLSAGAESDVVGSWPTDPATAELLQSLAHKVMASGEAYRLEGGHLKSRTDREGPSIMVGGTAGVMVLPLAGSDRPRGALCCVRSSPFTHCELEMALTFTHHVALALELGDHRRHQERVQLVEDRTRIARDLHDHVIQQLFAAGMTLQGVISGTEKHQQAETLEGVIDTIDEAINHIRTSIFHLRPSPMSSGSLRAATLEVVAEVRPILASMPRVSFEGPVDLVSEPELVLDVRAVLREALTNVARHARATRVDVSLRVDVGFLVAAICDNGHGLPEAPKRSGLANLAKRAQERGGTFAVTVPSSGVGTCATWRVPIT